MKKIELELDQSVYLKAKIKVFVNDRLVEIIEPKWENRYEIFSKINENILKELHDKR
jgi:hypothetical protein